MDCYDGSDDEPKVTHGFTLTGAIKLRDVCDAIRDYAFKASPLVFLVQEMFYVFLAGNLTVLRNGTSVTVVSADVRCIIVDLIVVKIRLDAKLF